MDDINAEIEQIDREICELRMKIRKLNRIRRRLIKPATGVDKLIEFVSVNPGCSRPDITKQFPRLTYQQVSNLILVAKRNRGAIVNRGNRTYSRWYCA